MSKAKKAKKRTHGHSSLGAHKRNKKVLTAPFNQLDKLSFSSWIDGRLPEFIWAALLTENLPRKRYLNLFRSVIGAAQHFRTTTTYIGHSNLEKVSSEDFSKIFAVVLADVNAVQALSPLLLIPELPDFKHWQLHLPVPDPEKAWSSLGRSIGRCLAHQSEAATDIRWLKVAFMGVQHRLHIPAELAGDLVGYPDVGDLTRIRPFIRSMEIGVAMPDTLLEKVEWPAKFWQICWQRTQCRVDSPPIPQQEFEHEKFNRAFAETYAHLGTYFFETNTTTEVDPRHDGVFGLALYGLTVLASLFRPHSTRPAGRIILRSLVEVYLTLAYLLHVDSNELWLKYRRHGSGQAKLAFLKLTESGVELPKYVSMETLEGLASDDLWQEFIDINVGHWAGKDLRRMSEEAGVKDVYDAYYDWPSAFVHGQWLAVRNTNFAICANPLHRLHRVPRPPRLDLEDVSWDGVIIANKILDLVDRAYPTFEHRLQLTTEDKEAASNSSRKPRRRKKKVS